MSRILVIEDDREINALLCNILSQKGHSVTPAFTGLDGLDKARSQNYDIILLDLMLPYKSGDEVLRSIRETSDVPVIIISAKDITRTKIDLLHLGADDYITKPFDIDEVLARVEANLRRYCRSTSTAKILTYKDIILDMERKTVTVK